MLAGRDAEFADLEQLKQTEAVLLEAMRLYPPAWSVGREALVDVEIGGYRLPKGLDVLHVPVGHPPRSEAFRGPREFLPQRWAGDAQRRLPRFAYFPFGGGPRICIGNRFAMMEATLILAAMAQRFSFATRRRRAARSAAHRHVAPALARASCRSRRGHEISL